MKKDAGSMSVEELVENDVVDDIAMENKAVDMVTNQVVPNRVDEVVPERVDDRMMDNENDKHAHNDDLDANIDEVVLARQRKLDKGKSVMT